MALDPVFDPAHVAVEPGPGLADTGVGARGRAVVAADDDEVGAIVAELLVALERAA